MDSAGGSAAVDAYIRALPPKMRTLLRELRATIRSAAPQAEELISYRMPALRQGRILVYYGAFSDHGSLFVASARVRAEFRDELKPFFSGKGTFQFTPEHPIPPGLVTRIIRARVAENAASAEAKKSARTSRPRGSSPRASSRAVRSSRA